MYVVIFLQLYAAELKEFEILVHGFLCTSMRILLHAFTMKNVAVVRRFKEIVSNNVYYKSTFIIYKAYQVFAIHRKII